MTTTLPTRPPDYLSEGPIDSADLAALLGSWTSKKGVVAIWKPESDVPPPITKMRKGVCVGGVSSFTLDGNPWTNRLASLEVRGDPAIPRTPEGWPVPTGSQVAYLLTDTGERPTPPGEYVLSYVGSGDVRMSDRGINGPKLDPKPPDFTPEAGVPSGQRYVVKEGHVGGVQVEVRNSDPADPVKDVMFAPESDGHWTIEEAWTSPLAGRASTVRFLGWTRLESDMKYDAAGNYVPREVKLTPKDVPLLSNAVLFGDAPPNLTTELASVVIATPWLCVIDGAESGYYQKYAERLRFSVVDTVILEYSNETWNSVFDQCHRIMRRAKAAGISASRQYAREALACFRIFKLVLGDRFRGVLACHLANSNVAAEILDEASKAADFKELVHAIAPSGYWYPTIVPPAKPTVAELVADCATQIDTTYRRQLTDHKALADRYGVELYCYEWGFHPPGKHSGDPIYSAYLNSSDIATNYAQALAVCEQVGVSLCNHMGMCGKPDSTWWLTNKLGDTSHPRWTAFFGAARAGDGEA